MPEQHHAHCPIRNDICAKAACVFWEPAYEACKVVMLVDVCHLSFVIYNEKNEREQ
jgi:hypothetical protein